MSGGKGGNFNIALTSYTPPAVVMWGFHSAMSAVNIEYVIGYCGERVDGSMKDRCQMHPMSPDASDFDHWHRYLNRALITNVHVIIIHFSAGIYHFETPRIPLMLTGKSAQYPVFNFESKWSLPKVIRWTSMKPNWLSRSYLSVFELPGQPQHTINYSECLGILFTY